MDILYNNVEVGKSINFDLIDEGKVQTLDQVIFSLHFYFVGININRFIVASVAERSVCCNPRLLVNIDAHK